MWENLSLLVAAAILTVYGIITLLWWFMPPVAKEIIIFSIKTWIANKFTWKVKKDGDSPKV